MVASPDPSTLALQSDLLANHERHRIRVLLAAPRGFCAGVRRAINAVLDALAVHGPPVYVRRSIVHNLEVVKSLEAEGAIFVQELEEVPEGSVVLFSAHGVSPSIKRRARKRNLITYDAVCPLVAKVHREVERHDKDGRQVLLIGHEGHPEIEGTKGHIHRRPAFVVNSTSEVERLKLDRNAPTAYAVQTTYSVDDAADIIAELQTRFSNLRGPERSDICYATTNRQAAVRKIAVMADATIVVGEQFSSNATRLLEVASALCPSAFLVSGPEALDWSRLQDANTVGISAAASTPESSVERVVAALEARFSVVIEEIEVARELTKFKRLPIE